MHNTYVGSHPIYDKNLEIHAYQLLFRNNEVNRASFTDGDRATSEVILNSLTDIGLDKLVGRHKACINFTRNFILGEYPIPAMKDRIIIELDEEAQPDTAVIDALHKLSEQGYTLALPAAVFAEYFNRPSAHHYIVRYDLTRHEPKTIKDQLPRLRRNSVRLLASKVETQDLFKSCTALGFDYYQGYFFCQPSIIKGKGIPASKIQMVQLLQKLQDENSDSKEIDRLIGGNLGLSYRILRYANSSLLGLHTRVDSIQHAVSLLGWDTVRMITILLILSSIDDKPPELFRQGLIRAKMCERLTTYVQRVDKNMAFTAGLLSIIDVLLDTPMKEVLDQLPLSQKLSQALLTHEGELGAILYDSITYIHDRPRPINRSGLNEAAVRACFLQALIWANATIPEIQP